LIPPFALTVLAHAVAESRSFARSVTSEPEQLQMKPTLIAAPDGVAPIELVALAGVPAEPPVEAFDDAVELCANLSRRQ
jgi:hypothetical protein